MPTTTSEAPPRKEWDVARIRELGLRVFGKRPCWLQVKITLALRAGKDVVGIAATGAGKTLSFWLALLMALEDGDDKMVVVVTPLNLLGKQNEKQLTEAGLTSIAVTKDNNKPQTYRVSYEALSRISYSILIICY